MYVLTVATILVGGVALLNLVLILGVLRRLREHASALGEMEADRAGPDAVLPVGATVEEFAATTVTGARLTPELLVEPTLVGFFSPGCGPCGALLPEFVEYVRRSRHPAVAIVVESEGTGRPAADEPPTGEAATMIRELTEVADVVREAPEGSMGQAFRITGYPSVFLLEAGSVVAASGANLRALPALVTG